MMEAGAKCSGQKVQEYELHSEKQKQLEQLQHEQLQEQRQQLKEILEQQKKVHDEEDLLPVLNEEHCFSGCSSSLRQVPALLPLHYEECAMIQDSDPFSQCPRADTSLELLQPVQPTYLSIVTKAGCDNSSQPDELLKQDQFLPEKRSTDDFLLQQQEIEQFQLQQKQLKEQEQQHCHLNVQNAPQQPGSQFQEEFQQQRVSILQQHNKEQQANHTPHPEYASDHEVHITQEGSVSSNQNTLYSQTTAKNSPAFSQLSTAAGSSTLEGDQTPYSQTTATYSEYSLDPEEHLADEPTPDNVIVIGPESLSQPLKRPRHSYVPKPKLTVSVLNLQCEWNICTQVFTKMEEFVKHVETHIHQIVATEGALSEDGAKACLWLDCGNNFQEQAELLRHVYFHVFHTKLKAVGLNMQQQHNMQVCQLDTEGRNLVPQIPEPFECQWEECRMVFVSAQHFYWHIENHAHCAELIVRDTKKLYACGWEGCRQLLPKICNVKEHARSHSQEKKMGCPRCGAIFASKKNFMDHLLRQKPLEGLLYQCSCCSRRFANERLVRDHLRHHINHWKCPHCDMTCSSHSNLECHIRYRHSDVRPHLCPHCDKRFKGNMDLQRHLVTHTEHKLFRCNYSGCEVKCKTYCSIDRHIKKEHLYRKDVYACHLCPETRCSGGLLSKHLTRGHNLTWPSGHSRFLYRRDAEGRFRLQTVRFESLELAQGMDTSASCYSPDVDSESGSVDGGTPFPPCHSYPASPTTPSPHPSPSQQQPTTAATEPDHVEPLASELLQHSEMHEPESAAGEQSLLEHSPHNGRHLQATVPREVTKASEAVEVEIKNGRAKRKRKSAGTDMKKVETAGKWKTKSATIASRQPAAGKKSKITTGSKNDENTSKTMLNNSSTERNNGKIKEKDKKKDIMNEEEEFHGIMIPTRM